MENNVAKNVVYTVSHLIDGKLKKALVVPSVTKALAIVSTATDTEVDNARTRSAVALSFSDGNAPFTMVHYDEKNNGMNIWEVKHVFRIDKQELNIGVKVR